MEAVARLHAESWRASYRGILSDEFLDGPIFEDRIDVWQGRLAGTTRAANQLILLAEENGALRAFVCAFLDADPRWGAFLDNLHVAPDWQGRRLGKRLMADAGAWVAAMRPGEGLYLLVFEENRAARGFYEHLGGRIVERYPHHAPDGTHLITLRYWWKDARSLAR